MGGRSHKSHRNEEKNERFTRASVVTDHQGGYSGKCPCFSETALLGQLQVSVDLHVPHLFNMCPSGQRAPFRREHFQVAESKVKQRLLVFNFRTGFFYDTATTVAWASSGIAFSFIRWPTPTNTNMCTQKKNPCTLCQTNTKQTFSNCVFYCVDSSFLFSLSLLFGWQCWHETEWGNKMNRLDQCTQACV